MNQILAGHGAGQHTIARSTQALQYPGPQSYHHAPNPPLMMMPQQQHGQSGLALLCLYPTLVLHNKPSLPPPLHLRHVPSPD